jgi:azurin
LGGKARQSSVTNGGDAARAIDGRTDGSYSSSTQTHTQEDENNPWWEVDLGNEYPVQSVVIWNRTDDGLGRRLEGFTLSLLDSTRHATFTRASQPAPAKSAAIPIGDSSGSSTLVRAAIQAAVSMPRDQAATFAALVGLIAHQDEVTAAAQGLRILPRSAWPKPEAARAATALLAWAKKVPAEARTSQDFIETVQCAGDLAGFLAPADAQALRQELREMRVPIFVLRTVREQMRYDTPRIVVEAGKAFEIILENADFMPHNLAVVRPGTREKVANLAAVMKPEELDSRGRAYMPNTQDILAATKLLEAGQRARLSLTAPEEAGTYEYVCTYPNHWMVMWGQLIVTKDVEGYLQANPEAPVPTAAAAEHDHHHAK